MNLCPKPGCGCNHIFVDGHFEKMAYKIPFWEHDGPEILRCLQNYKSSERHHDMKTLRRLTIGKSFLNWNSTRAAIVAKVLATRLNPGAAIVASAPATPSNPGVAIAANAHVTPSGAASAANAPVTPSNAGRSESPAVDDLSGKFSILELNGKS